MVKTKSEEKYKPWNFDDTLKKFITSGKKESDFQSFKKELIANEYTEEIADIFMRVLKIDVSKIGKK